MTEESVVRFLFLRTAMTCAAVAGLTFAVTTAAVAENPHLPLPPLTVPKATCGPHDHPETALQGQVTAAERAFGFKGFSCNLELIGQVRGDGASWQSDEYRARASRDDRQDKDDRRGKDDDEGHGKDRARGDRKDVDCAYFDTAFTTADRTHVGVSVIDITKPNTPTPTTYLSTTAMLDPWESLKVNERRSLLAGTDAHNAGLGQGGPEVDIYDISTDCRYPQFLTSQAIGTGTDGGLPSPNRPQGHEGAFSPDGLTYYIGDIANSTYHAIDMTDPTRPKQIAYYVVPGGPIRSHGLSVSDDGNRMYGVELGIPPGYNPATPANNGFFIFDTSEVQRRLPNPQIKLISAFEFKDGSLAQHTIPVKIKGRPYVIHVDEGGSGGISGWSSACAASVPPFPMPRIVDISDEKNPKQVSRIMLETHNPVNCPLVLPDIVGLASFTYGSHYCSVDNRDNATTLACGMFNSGLRVFDIRDPVRPREIAYYNPAGTTTASPGSNHAAQWKAGGPDWCSAQVHLNADNGTIWSTCQDNGMLMLKFTNGAWPFPESSTPPGRQN